MAQKQSQPIDDILKKLNELKLEEVSVKKVVSADLSAYGRAHSLESESAIVISGEVKKEQKQAAKDLNTYINEIKPQIQDMKVQCSVSCPMKIGDTFESVTEGLTDLDGNPKTLEHKKGEVLIIDFWATWCGPCQQPMKHNQEILAKKREDFKDKVRIVGFGLDKTAEKLKERAKDLQDVEHYHASQGFQHPVVSGSYGVKGIPNIVIFDKEGKMVFQDHPSKADLENTIEKLINDKYEPPETKDVGKKFGKVENIKKMDGTSATIEADGKVKLVDFWATWCGPCQKPMQHNIDMMEKNKDSWTDNVRIIGLSCDDDLEAPKARIEEKKWDSIEQYQLEGGFEHQTPGDFEVEGIPHCVLVDKNDIIVWKGHPSSVDLEDCINKLIKGEEISTEKPDEGNAQGEIKDSSAIIDQIKTQGEYLKDLKDDEKPWILVSDSITYKVGKNPSQTLQVMRRKYKADEFEKAKEFLSNIQKACDEKKITIKDV